MKTQRKLFALALAFCLLASMMLPFGAATNADMIFTTEKGVSKNFQITSPYTESSFALRNEPEGITVNETGCLTVPATLAADDYIFHCIITDKTNAQNTLEKSILLAVIDKTPPSITFSQLPETATAGPLFVTYTVTSPVPLKQLTLNGSMIPTAIGQTTFTGTISVTANGSYTVEAMNDLSAVTRETLTVTCIDTAKPTVEVTKYPSQFMGQKSILLFFTAKDDNSVTKVSVNGVSVAQPNEPSYIGMYHAYLPGLYEIRVDDGAGNFVTTQVILTVQDFEEEEKEEQKPQEPEKPVFSFFHGANPTVQTVSDNRIDITAPLTNGTSVTYRWQKIVNGSFTTLSGETAALLSVVPKNGDTYRVVLTDNYGSELYSDPVTVTVTVKEPELPSITEITVTGLPENMTVEEGGLFVAVPEPMNGTWKFDSNYLSGSDSGVSIFIARKAGVTPITYTVTDSYGRTVTKTFILTITEVKNPHTSDN